MNRWVRPPVWCAVLLLAALPPAGLAQAPTPAHPQVWTGTVVHVGDGDTVYVKAADAPAAVAVRLLGMDAPEICQEGGAQARQALAEMVLHHRVTVVGEGRDSYGRDLARVYAQGRDVGRQMVALGHAWSLRHGRASAADYGEEQQQAQAARRGLFAQAHPELPRDFRQRHGSCKE